MDQQLTEVTFGVTINGKLLLKVTMPNYGYSICLLQIYFVRAITYIPRSFLPADPSWVH